MKPYFPNLMAEMARQGVSAEQMARALDRAGETLRAHLSGETNTPVWEAIAIAAYLNKARKAEHLPLLSVEYLYEKGEKK